MSVNTPPTENIPIFDPSVFPSASGTALTIASGSKYFLTYPVAQGSEIFPSNVTLQSTLTDASGDVGTAGQILSSTGTGTNWIDNTGGENAYITLNTSTLPTTLPIPTEANTYVYITGTLNDGGALTIPTSGVTTGTFINFKNYTALTVNIIGSSFILYSSFGTTTPPYVLGAGCSASFYYNGTVWVQANVDRTFTNLFSSTGYIGLLGTDNIAIDSTHSGTPVNVYSDLIDADLNIAKLLPAPHTVRIANTASGASGGSVHCSNIGFDGSNINNATTPALGTIKLGNSLTSGPLYIACGSATATHTTGPIIIGSDSTATGGINIGTGTNTTVPTVNTVNIGSATYTTNVLGPLVTSSTILASGNITAGAGSSLIAPTVRNGANTGSISTAGVLTGTSVVSPSLNAAANTTDVGICTTQTSGVLNIGTGARSITGLGGSINIGTGSGGTAVPLNIGSSGSVITVAGGTTFNGRINTTLGPIAGLLSFEIKNVSYTIVSSTINREYWIVVTLNNATTTFPAPATRTDQIIHIRNATSLNQSITTPSGLLYPNVVGNTFTTWTAFAGNTSQTFYSNGTNWYGFS